LKAIMRPPCGARRARPAHRCLLLALWELRQRAKEAALMRELGLDAADAAPTTPTEDTDEQDALDERRKEAA
ncbi:MAG: hypothetical protein AAFQ71_15825, partial [Planctomycetota bacterium]